MPYLLMTIGATLGMMLVVGVFRWIAGASFTHWRHVLAAYLAVAIAATFISAVGEANGGAPDFQMAPIQWIGACLASVIELARIKGANRAA